jgi:hypothetical protein
MKLLAPASLLLVLAAGASTAGCASSCIARSDKLASLKRGMTYDEATAAMGCPGTQVSARAPDQASVTSVEWDGPVQRVGTRTQLDFRDGRLLSYTTDNRGGW